MVWPGLSCIISLLYMLIYICKVHLIITSWKFIIKFHKLLMNCFKRVVSVIAVITKKAMCIQFAEHFSIPIVFNRYMHVYENVEWTLWTASYIPNFQNINRTLTIFIFYFGFRLICLVCEDIWRNSYFKNASSLIKCHTT